MIREGHRRSAMINRYISLCFVFSFTLVMGCARNGDQPQDGQTHWLETCDKNSECGELECVCGFCVQTCDEERACDVEGMTTDCKPVDSEAVEALCQSEEPPDRVCLEPCSGDSKCDKGQACIGGACVPVESEAEDAGPSEFDAGQTDDGQQKPDVDAPSQGILREELLYCLNGGVVIDQDINKVEKLDLLFVVDNSRSMEAEQAKLRAQLPRMIKILTTGDKTPDNGTENIDFPPVKDMHLAVVSSDMGLPGLGPEDNPDTTGACNGTGDDGNFLNDPSNAIAAGLDCPGSGASGYPLFLVHERDDRVDPDVTLQRAEATAADFACLTTLGFDGCGFEMPLEPALKALWPSQIINLTPTHQALGITFLAGSQGHGDNEHRSFLRGTPYHPTEADRLSVLAIIIVTDEADCSVGARGNLDFLSLNFPGGDRLDLNLRCYKDTINNWGNKYPVERYINGFKALRPSFTDLVVFSAIAGIPTGVVMDTNGDNDISNDERDDFYDQILSHPAMQETVNPQTNNLEYSCVHVDASSGLPDTQAYPARRLTEVARGFGPNGTIQSICADDFSPAMNALIDIISNKIGGVCLPTSYTRDSDGMINCEVTWTMPPGWTCDDYEFLSDPPANFPLTDKSGRAICVVDQIPVINTNTDNPAVALDFSYKTGLGWYYDDFSGDMKSTCRTTQSITTKQRIAFTLNRAMNGANEDPPSGVSIDLTCRSKPAQSETEEEGVAQGWSCEWDGCSEGDFYCHESTDLCVAACETDTDCEANDLPLWRCGFAEDGERFCVPPTCNTIEIPL